MINFSKLAPCLSLLLILCADVAQAQWDFYWREDRKYYRPMLADIRRSQNHMRLYRDDPVPFTNPKINDAEHLFWDVGFGDVLSILGGQCCPNLSKADYGKSSWVENQNHLSGFDIFLDGAAHMLLDFGAESNAVINTDFRIGGGLKAKYKHLSLKYRWFHECTHIGDEFVLDALVADPPRPDFQRYNVGFNAQEIFLAVDSHFLPQTDTWLLKSIRYSRAYVGLRDLGSDSDTHRAFKRLTTAPQAPLRSKTDERQIGAELALDWQSIMPTGFNKALKKYMVPNFDNLIFAAEQYRRSQYTFTEPTYTNAYNFTVGFSWGKYLSNDVRAPVAILFNYYTGPNPHGQFRTEKLSYIGVDLSLKL